MIIKDLGAVSAYAYAVEKGYTGTEEEFATLIASYASVAEEAAESAEYAQASATTASSAASTATTKASEATTAAQTATAKAEETQADADAAALDASQALSAASTATSKASEAAQSASDATTAKTAAQTAQTAAEGSATTAQTAAQTATQKATEAAESARTLTIDTTLAKSGQAADSKVVGDEITDLKEDLSDVENATIEMKPNLFNKQKAMIGEINSNGTLYYGDQTVYELSEYIDVSNINSVAFYRAVNGAVTSASCYAVLFNENKQLVGTRIVGSSADVSNASYIIVNPQQVWHDAFMVCSSNNVPTTYIPYGVEFKYIDSIKTIEYVGQGCKYTSILKALKYSDADIIIVNSGTYNVVNEYKEEYGSSFWENYAGYSGSADNFMKGLWIKDREVILSPNAKVIFDYDGNNTNVGSYFSIFALSKNAKLKGGYLQAVNLPNANNAMLRYFIHDDFENWLEGTNEYDGIIFDGSVRSSAVIGAGCGIHNRYIISNCIFLNNSRPYDISYHNNGSDGVNFIDIHGCYGNSVCAFRWYGTGHSLTHCVAHDNHFSKIECVAHTEEPNENENMVLHAWNNEVDS